MADLHFSAQDVRAHMESLGLTMLTERELWGIVESLDLTLLVRERTVRRSAWALLRRAGWSKSTMRAAGITAWMFHPPKEEGAQ